MRELIETEDRGDRIAFKLDGVEVSGDVTEGTFTDLSVEHGPGDEGTISETVFECLRHAEHYYTLTIPTDEIEQVEDRFESSMARGWELDQRGAYR